MTVEHILADLAPQVDANQLHRHLVAMPGPRHRSADPAAIESTLLYLEDGFRASGWKVAEQPCQDVVLGPGLNVIAALPGQRADAVVMVGAHHDTVPETPGADDNGSGLAALLEIARLLPRHRWEATIELVAFDFEETETGRFSGSRAYVNDLLARQTELRGAFILEMIAYRSHASHSQRIPAGIDLLYPEQIVGLETTEYRGNFIVALGSDHSRTVLQRFIENARTHVPELAIAAFPVPAGFPVRDMFRSDHVPFWEASLPAVMLTDTAEFRNPHYHRTTDTAATLDPSFWRSVVAATLVSVASLAAPVGRFDSNGS
jgi:Zn-dependent M28 family amino/carboxypeptidase